MAAASSPLLSRSLPLTRDVDAALTAIEQDEDVEAIVITGAGKRAFVA